MENDADFVALAFRECQTARLASKSDNRAHIQSDKRLCYS
jgi:hypothetical protein